MKRIHEINQRLTEIRAAMTNPETEVDMDALETEVTALTEERTRLTEQETRLRDRIGAEVIDRAAPPETETREAMTSGSEVYRSAWGAYMMGQRLSEEQRAALAAVNVELRDADAFIHDTNNTAVLVPESVVAGIWSRAGESYPLWGDVRKFAVAGTLVSKRHTAITQGDAAWYDEDDTVADEANTFAEFTLSGCELAKSVSVSWKMRAMAVPEFISFLTREIGDRMGVALGNAVYSGKGVPGVSDTFKQQPLGIKTALLAETNTPQVVTYTAGSLAEDDLRDAVAKLHSSYVPGAVIYANNKTVWTVLAAIRDTNGHSIFVPDAANQGAVGRIFGKPVRVDAALADGEVLIGDPQMYWANVAQSMTMHTEEHVKQRVTDYMGYAIVDGAPYDTQAFALVKTAAT